MPSTWLLALRLRGSDREGGRDGSGRKDGSEKGLSVRAVRVYIFMYADLYYVCLHDERAFVQHSFIG